MVVEDVFLVRKLMCDLLEEHGYVSIDSTDGIPALKKIATMTDKIDLILCDLKMPNMNGFDFLTQIKKEPATKDIPVIMVSSAANQSDIVQAIQLGASDYIVKPFTREVLLSKVIRQIGTP